MVPCNGAILKTITDLSFTYLIVDRNLISHQLMPSVVFPQGSLQLSSMHELTKPVFGLTPHRMDLNPGKSLNVILEGNVDTYVHTTFSVDMLVDKFYLIFINKI